MLINNDNKGSEMSINNDNPINNHLNAEFVSWAGWMEIVCKHKKKWGVYINGMDGYLDDESPEIAKALQKGQDKFGMMFHTNSVVGGNLCLVGTEKEAREIYNHYDSPPLSDSCVYACLISPADGIICENT